MTELSKKDVLMYYHTSIEMLGYIHRFLLQLDILIFI